MHEKILWISIPAFFTFTGTEGRAHNPEPHLVKAMNEAMNVCVYSIRA
jgi:hypothetical protein